MQSGKSKIHLSTITLLVILINGFSTYGQISSEISLYNWFDNIVGKENLAINNGALHIYPYKTIDKSDSYYITDKFSKGNVSYDGQVYYDVNLKYDIYRDLLVLKPNSAYDYMGLNLTQEKTDSFLIHGKNFVNLSNLKSPKPEFINGYYEECVIGKTYIFYIKHHKDRREFINVKTVYDVFEEDNEYVLYHKNTFQKVSSKKDIRTIFPEYKNQINEFYLMNQKMERLDKKQFMENLMKYINNFLQNGSN
ncbi:hypothetical protein [Flavobacterium sp.]|uniref:hypothetical protein n=1 Tax=Flavobacterium sp. TaxID=239 RepID=UPI002B4AFDCD|nr:hypothetical protein [Flavobacterium sp.]HLF52212.1 hypothetical protein [Flavobacterium sp.]